MNRPARKRTHLLEKLENKLSRSRRGPGKRAKRWKKWAAEYEAIADTSNAE